MMTDVDRRQVVYVACMVVGLGCDDISEFFGVTAAIIDADRRAEHARWVEKPRDRAHIIAMLEKFVGVARAAGDHFTEERTIVELIALKQNANARERIVIGAESIVRDCKEDKQWPTHRAGDHRRAPLRSPSILRIARRH